MKTEIESRLLDLDAKKFINKLIKNNATFVGDYLQLRYCYDFTPAKQNSWIRLRTNGTETTLTIKEITTEKIDGTKELEIVVSDFNETNEILNKLGYTARSIQENRRIRYILNGVEIDIDFWPMIPTYAEFEGKTEEDIKNVCKILEIDYSSLVTIGVDSIYKHYGFDLSTIPVIKLEEERKQQTIVLASNNAHKIKEFREIFNTYKILSLKDIGFTSEIVEDGNSFVENSKIKAITVSEYLKKNNITASIIADDSGLCVESLNGAPGIFSARYSGDHDDQKNRNKLLKDLENHNNRNAYFCCVLVELTPNGEFITAEGRTYGKITTKEIGDTSFGYDCLFFSNDLNKTFGEASSEEKNNVSHRGRAISELLKLRKS